MVAQVRGVRFVQDRETGRRRDLVPTDQGNVIAQRALEDVAHWLGYPSFMEYNFASSPEGDAMARLKAKKKVIPRKHRAKAKPKRRNK